MQKIKFPGYEFIGKSSIETINYHNPKGPKRKVTLDVFIQKATGEEFVKPQGKDILINLKRIIEVNGKKPQPIYYDISQALKFYPY